MFKIQHTKLTKPTTQTEQVTQTQRYTVPSISTKEQSAIKKIIVYSYAKL